MSVILGFLLLLLLWTICICPRLPKRDIPIPAKTMFAHRGLWNPDFPENSLSAFENAVNHGFGIELDIQMTRDGHLVVFHDANLARMCGVKRILEDLTWDELSEYTLLSSHERIPLFADVLACVHGRVPLIVEIKTCKRIQALCESADILLQQYVGHYTVESFDPRAMRWFRVHRPDIIRGQLCYGLKGEKYKKSLMNRLLASLLQNVLSRPDFIAFDCDTDRSVPFRIVKALFHPWTVAWTVQTQERSNLVREQYDFQIFEGFIPDTKE